MLCVESYDWKTGQAILTVVAQKERAFADMIRRLRVSMADGGETSRYALCSVQVTAGQRTATLCATNTRWMSLESVDVVYASGVEKPTKNGPKIEIRIPPKVVREICKTGVNIKDFMIEQSFGKKYFDSIDDDKPVTTVTWTKKGKGIVKTPMRVSDTISPGRFPEVLHSIPTSHTTHMSGQCTDWRNLLPNNYPTLVVSGSKLEYQTVIENSKKITKLPKLCSGNDSICLNWDVLGAWLSHHHDKVVIDGYWDSEGHAVLFKSGNSRFVIMPISTDV